MGFRCQVVLRPFLSELGIYIVRDWLAFPQVHSLMDENSKFMNPEDESRYTQRLERVFDSVSTQNAFFIFCFGHCKSLWKSCFSWEFCLFFRLNGQRMPSKNTKKKCLHLLPLNDLQHLHFFSIIQSQRLSTNNFIVLWNNSMNEKSTNNNCYSLFTTRRVFTVFGCNVLYLNFKCFPK